MLAFFNRNCYLSGEEINLFSYFYEEYFLCMFLFCFQASIPMPRYSEFQPFPYKGCDSTEENV